MLQETSFFDTVENSWWDRGFERAPAGVEGQSLIYLFVCAENLRKVDRMCFVIDKLDCFEKIAHFA
jgi:hypothetical protein